MRQSNAVLKGGGCILKAPFNRGFTVFSIMQHRPIGLHAGRGAFGIPDAFRWTVCTIVPSQS